MRNEFYANCIMGIVTLIGKLRLKGYLRLPMRGQTLSLEPARTLICQNFSTKSLIYFAQDGAEFVHEFVKYANKETFDVIYSTPFYVKCNNITILVNFLQKPVKRSRLIGIQLTQ